MGFLNCLDGYGDHDEQHRSIHIVGCRCFFYRLLCREDGVGVEVISYTKDQMFELMDEPDFQRMLIKSFIESGSDGPWKSLKINLCQEIADALGVKPGNVTIGWEE